MTPAQLKDAVLKKYPTAVYVFFENSEIQHHIRVYNNDNGKSIGRGKCEASAWIGAYLDILDK